MERNLINHESIENNSCEDKITQSYSSELSRRDFIKILGSGILISISADASPALGNSTQDKSGRINISERLHIGVDGIITVMTSIVEVGQGSRTELTQAAAEELRVQIEDVRLVMGDTDLVPDDGHTGSSMTTPKTVPKLRKGCAAARELLINMAAEKWQVKSSVLNVNNGKIFNTLSNQTITYSELAKTENLNESFKRGIEDDISVTPVKKWKIMGKPTSKINSSEIVTGSHLYASDIVRPDMHYGKILYPPSFGAALVSIDTRQAEAMDDVTVVQEQEFIGVTAPTTHLAENALKSIAKTAKWKTLQQPSSKELFTYLKKHVSGGKDSKGRIIQEAGSVQRGIKNAKQVLSESYKISHIQHAPLEPRAAVAEWNDGKVTVWTGTANPFPVRNEIAKIFNISRDNVRIIVPDTGGHFCGKHTGEAAVQAARLARAVKRPVKVRWTREEEFTWAYFRKAGLIETRAGIDEDGNITAWEFTNYNSGTNAISMPYDIPNISIQFKSCDSPLREGSFRAVAAPANLFARESFMDELSYAANLNPLEFRLKHIKDARLKDVLETAVKRFNWDVKSKKKLINRGIGLACGTEKGSYIAACVEVEIDCTTGSITVLKVCQAFECGAIINPLNLRAQIEGATVMGLSTALWEEIQFENGRILNGNFRNYRISRFKDVPEIEAILIDRPDISSVGAGETPMIVIAPAIANAVYASTGIRIRSMPIKGDILKQG